MAKIDRIKEELNTLRLFLSIMIALMVAVGTGLVKSYRLELFDLIFYLGVGVEMILVILSVIIVTKIRKKTKEIEEL